MKTLFQTFRDAKVFDADLASWQTSSATDLSFAFSGAVSFRGAGVHAWVVGKVTDFKAQNIEMVVDKK